MAEMCSALLAWHAGCGDASKKLSEKRWRQQSRGDALHDTVAYCHGYLPKRRLRRQTILDTAQLANALVTRLLEEVFPISTSKP